MTTIQKEIQKHVENNCKNCDKKNCSGIRITANVKTVCEEKYER